MGNRILICLFILIFQIELLGQSPQIDSLLNQSKLLRKNSVAYVDTYNALAFEYYNYNDSLAMFYASQALNIATKINYPNGKRYAHLMMGIGYMSYSDYSNAEFQYKASLSGGDVESFKYQVYGLTLLANIYRDRGYYDSASYYYQKARASFSHASNLDKAVWYKNKATMEIKLWHNKLAISNLDSASALLEFDNFVQKELWSLYGKVYYQLNQYDSANYYNQKFCNEAEKGIDNYYKLKCLQNQINLATRAADYNQAIEASNRALGLVELYLYPPQKIELLISIGDIYVNINEYDLASSYYFQALKIAERHGFLNEIAYVQAQLGWVNKEQNNYILALDYLNRAQNTMENIGDLNGVSFCQNIRGLIFLLQKKYTPALEELEKSKTIRKKINNEQGYSSSQFNVALVLVEQNKLEQALNILQEVIAIEEGFDDKQNLAISYDYIASVYLKKRDFIKANEYLTKCKLLAQGTKSKLLLRNNAGYFAELYELTGDFKNALKYRKLYQELNDSIYSNASINKIAELEAIYQFEKKEELIQSLSKTRELQESQIELQKENLNQQRIIIIVSIVALAMAGLFMFFMFQYNRKVKKLNKYIIQNNQEIKQQASDLKTANEALVKLNDEVVNKNEKISAQSQKLLEANNVITEINKNLEQRVEERTVELKQAYKELDTFFYRASHDFRRPLTTFMGLAEVAKITIKDLNAIELFTKVDETAHNLDKMLGKLQSISNLGGQELIYKEVFLKELIEQIEDAYRELLHEKSFSIKQEINISTQFISYPSLVKIILENLIENAIIFNHSAEPDLNIKAYTLKGNTIIEIQDNGDGIPETHHERIFEMFFRGSEKSKGNGLGLYIVYKAVERLKGSIKLKSGVGSGSTFTISLPPNLIS